MKILQFGNDRPIQIPERWSECRISQLTRGLEIQLQIQERASDGAAVLACLDELAAELGGFEVKYLESLTIEERFEILEAVRWATYERVTERPFEYFRQNGTAYYLPKPNYEDTDAIELAMANMHYLAFSGGATGRLFELLATICRPQKWGKFIRKLSTTYEGNDREPFNSLLAVARAKKFETLPLGLCMAILQYWETENNKFYAIHAELYEGDDGRNLFKNGEGWIATLEDVAAAGLHGDFDKVCYTNVHTIWMYLKHRKVQIDEQQRLAEKED